MKITKALIAKSTLLLGALLAIGVPALAVPITGGFGTTSAGVMAFTTVGGDHKIDFCPPDPFSPVTGTPSCALGGPIPGEGLIVAQGGSGTFAGIVAPVGGTIKDMVDSANPIYSPTTFIPVGISGLSIDNFLTVSLLPLVNFQVNEFVAQTCGGDPTVDNTVCIGGFILTKASPDTAVVSFTLNGTIIAPGFDPTPFRYVVSGTFTESLESVVGRAVDPVQGLFSNTWSGSLTALDAGVPEPSTITMFGLAAIAMLFGRLHSKRGSDS